MVVGVYEDKTIRFDPGFDSEEPYNIPSIPRMKHRGLNDHDIFDLPGAGEDYVTIDGVFPVYSSYPAEIY